MKRLSVLVAALILLTVNVTAVAQDDEEIYSDLLEMCFYGGLSVPGGGASDFHDSLGAKTGYSVGLDFGIFVKYNMVLGFNFIYSQLGIDASGLMDEASLGSSEHRLYNPNLYFKYYLIGESNFEPYLKLHVGVENAKFITGRTNPTRFAAASYDPALAYGAGAGIFMYTSDFSGLFLEANYHVAHTKDASREYENETLVFGDNLSTIDIHAGVRILVGSDE